MTIEDTIPCRFGFAPDADDAIECEFNTRELKTIIRRRAIALVHDANQDTGYDPYNTGAHPRFTRR